MRKHLRKLLPGHETIRGNCWLKPLESRLLHPRLWHLNRHSVAGAVAVGLFCGPIPGPFQMLGAALCALAFRVNLPLALITTLYTNPFTIIPLYVLAYEIGRTIVGGESGFVAPPELDWSHPSEWPGALAAWVMDLGHPLGIGLPILALALALAGYAVSKAAWRCHLLLARHRRSRRRLRS